jgi:hypothetical protein
MDHSQSIIQLYPPVFAQKGQSAHTITLNYGDIEQSIEETYMTEEQEETKNEVEEKSQQPNPTPKRKVMHVDGSNPQQPGITAKVQKVNSVPKGKSTSSNSNSSQGSKPGFVTSCEDNKRTLRNIKQTEYKETTLLESTVEYYPGFMERCNYLGDWFEWASIYVQRLHNWKENLQEAIQVASATGISEDELEQRWSTVRKTTTIPSYEAWAQVLKEQYLIQMSFDNLMDIKCADGIALHILALVKYGEESFKAYIVKTDLEARGYTSDPQKLDHFGIWISEVAWETPDDVTYAFFATVTVAWFEPIKAEPEPGHTLT